MSRRGIERAIEDITVGKSVVVVDDTVRDGNAALVFAAARATPALVTFAVRHTFGYLRVSLPGDECDRLGLPPMCGADPQARAANHTVTVDAAQGGTTGISATDRARTIRLLADQGAGAEDFTRPGHLTPVRIASGGVLRRPCHAEAAADLVSLAGLRPAGAWCEIVSTHGGEVAGGEELVAFAAEHELSLITISDLIAHRLHTDRGVGYVTLVDGESFPSRSGAQARRDGDSADKVVGMTGSQVDQLIVEAEVRRTLAEYCQSCDDGRFGDFARCFTPDAVVRIREESLVGRPAITEWIEAAMPPNRRGHHLTTNIIVVLGEDSATVSSDFVLVGRGPEIVATGRYNDELVPYEGRWLISQREIALL